ncbi:reverse transcriptase [Cucumis melo var. makuwa]|uniref:Reverse transcriptase n=1 Tax=Cucumis melo var. makuwa TaxID=1194695 RepID=A0A5A7TTE3_CUCMM|nr:reverse transcriptase [Cucumis melo var. makuwa]
MICSPRESKIQRFFPSTPIAQMMKLTLKIENREKVRKECELISVYGSKFQYNLPKAKENSETKSVTATTGGSTPMRTITLSEVTEANNRREGPSKRPSDAKFQARREKGLCFKCEEKYYAGHYCKAKEDKELRMLVVRDDGEEFEIIEEEVEGKVAEENTIEVGTVENVNIELFINSVVGLTNLGTMKVKGKVKNEDVLLPLELGGVDVILGMHWLHFLGVTKVDWKHLITIFQHEGRKVIIRGDSSLTKKGMRRFEDVFEWPETLPPKRGIEHHIHLKQWTNPVNMRPYRYAHQQKEEMERLVDNMVASRIIRPSTSPYSNPVLLVRKKDESWRFCVDYRALNNVTIPDKFPIPVIEKFELNGANMFSKIDLKVGYHQIRRNQEDVEKTVFRTHKGHCEFLVMPFGLTNASSTFQALMNAVFKPYMRWVGYFGHIISEKGVEVDPEKIRAIKEWSTPTNVRENGAFKWNEESNESFKKLKKPMMTLPVMAMPDFNLPFEIETYAFGYGVRAILTQAKRPIAYFSQTMSTRDRARLVYERELIVVVFAVQKWRPYVLGRKFIMKTGQRSLKFLLEQRVIQPQYQKWIAKLLGYSFEVVYRPELRTRQPMLKEIKSIMEQNPDDIPNFTIHQGVLQFNGRTYKRITGELYWDGMKKDIKKYYEEYGLPKSDRYEVIFVVVDRMSKYAHFIALKHLYTAKSVAEIFVKEIVRLHGYPRSIVLDRDRKGSGSGTFTLLTGIAPPIEA